MIRPVRLMSINQGAPLMTPLLGQIVRLTKSILLKPMNSERRPSAQFIVGKHSLFIFPGSTGLTWWYGDDTFDAIDAVALLLTKKSAEFRNCDLESVSGLVMKTLQEVCVDKTIFDVNDVLFARKQTLFQCYARSIPQSAELILEALEANLRTSIYKRCTLYAVPRFKVSSFCLENDTMHIIAKHDRTAWQRLVDKGYEFGGWTPENPTLGTSDTQTFAPPTNFGCVLVAEEYGTQKGTRFSSILRFRKLTSVLFSIAEQRADYPYHKAMARSSEFCIQFPHQSGANGTIMRSECGALIPYFASDIPIGEEDVEELKCWYKTSSICSQEVQQRIEKGAHFLSRALNASDIESYINYFVALDALFGERGAVEASIVNGVRSLGIDSTFSEKTHWLFDLRNELVHGGSRYITEWREYARYVKHFRTKPIADIRSLAQLAVLNAPRVLGQWITATFT